MISKKVCNYLASRYPAKQEQAKHDAKSLPNPLLCDLLAWKIGPAKFHGNP